MSIERLLLLFIWISFPIILYYLVPKQRYREMVAVFLFFQALTWIFSIVLASHDLLTAVAREFPDATKINFTLEYFAYPAAAVLFQLSYPENKGILRTCLHYVIAVTAILLFMIILGLLSKLVTISFASFYVSACNFTIELILCRKYIVWFTGASKKSRQQQGAYH